MAVLLANNATSQLASSLTAGATALSVTSGTGAKFPSPTGGDWFPLTLIKSSGALEILKCTARVGDVFTVVRAQEGTASMAFEAGDRVELRATAGVFTEGQQKTAEAKQAADAAQQAADGAQEEVDTLDGLAVKKDANTTTGAALMPGGTEAQRPSSPSNGMLRYNSEKHQFEGYQNGQWGQVGGGAPLFDTTWCADRANIPAGYVAADGQLLSRATYPDAAAALVAGKMPQAGDATWLADPLERGKYTLGDGSTTFRLPDYNGKFAGSLGAPFMRGDGALSAGVAGAIQRDAMQPITGSLAGMIGGASMGVAGALSYIRNSAINAATGSAIWGVDTITLNSANSPGVRTASENRPLNVTGCWVIKLFGAVVNVGSADAAQLASDYANIVGKLEETPWITPTLLNSWVPAPGYQPPQYKRIGNRVYVRGVVQGGAAGLIFGLAIGYRPPASLLFPSIYGSGATALLSCQPGGNVSAGALGTGVLPLEFSFEV